VEGHLVQDLWQDRETGKNMEKIKVEAENIQFMPRSRSADSPDPRPYADYDDSYPEPQPDGPVGGNDYVPFYGAPPEPAQIGVDPSISEEY
jgi:single-stranded DNA-binding protein